MKTIDKYLNEASKHGVVSNMDESVAKELSRKIGADVSVRAKKDIRFIFGDVEFQGKEKDIITWLARKYGVNTRFINLDLSLEGGDITVTIEEG